MLTYKYEALSKDGMAVGGVVEAHNEYEAIVKIKENGSVLLKITQIRSADAEAMNAGGKVKAKALAMVCSQFSIIVRAGMPLVHAVELIAAQTSDKNLRHILEEVALDVAAGFSLAQSFENNGPFLPSTFIETIRSGEECGTLEVAFERLHKYYESSAKLRGKVISALSYPAFVCGVAVIVLVIIMKFAVPVFISSFLDMDIEMPLPTKMLIATSEFFGKYSLHLGVVVAVLILAYIVYNKTEKGHMKIAEVMLTLPLLGKINLMKGASEFANTMSTMLVSGLPIIRAVAITAKAMSNHYLGAQLESAVAELEAGQGLASCLRKNPYLPDLLVEMTNIGEETGTLDSTLEVIGTFYDNETEVQTGRIVGMMEPIIICFLAVVVGWILLSVYMPMLGLYGNT